MVTSSASRNRRGATLATTQVAGATEDTRYEAVWMVEQDDIGQRCSFVGGVAR
jgi:hypothetical protein